MKKVWILEKFVSNEKMVKTLNEMEQMLEENLANFDKKGIESMNKTINSYKKRVEENPSGEWVGYQGKSIYRQFCDVARDEIRRADKSCKFRVIEAQIDDNAQYWSDYKLIKENEEVLHYLMATTKVY